MIEPEWAWMNTLNKNKMKEQIKGLIEYAKNPKYSEEGENYLSDGQMLDIILEQLERLTKDCS